MMSIQRADVGSEPNTNGIFNSQTDESDLVVDLSSRAGSGIMITVGEGGGERCRGVGTRYWRFPTGGEGVELFGEKEICECVQLEFFFKIRLGEGEGILVFIQAAAEKQKKTPSNGSRSHRRPEGHQGTSDLDWAFWLGTLSAAVQLCG